MKVKRERGWTGNSWGGISLGPPDPGPNGGKLHRGKCKILLNRFLLVMQSFDKDLFFLLEMAL